VQESIVAALVIFATLVSVWKLMPARLRLRALVAMDRWSSRYPAFAGFRERSLKPRIIRAAGSGCTGCAANTGIRQTPPR
jgi:hypothetical protein